MLLQYGSYKDLVKDKQALYPFAVDSPYEGKIVKKYVSNIESLSQIEELLSTDRNVYEVIRTITRKLYIDIDKVKLDCGELIQCVRQINSQLEKHLNVKISMDDVVILTNPPMDDIYSSVHIIYNTIVMDYLPMKKLIQYINDTSDLVLDDRVYTDNRLFRCLNQSKMYINKIGMPLIIFNQHNHKTPSISETMVSHTKGIKYYTFNEVFEIKKSKSLFKTPTEIIQVMIDNKYDCLFQDNRAGMWCKITQVIYQFPNIYNMNVWLEQSAQLSNEYSYEDNIIFLENIEDDDFEYNDENYLYYIINKKIPNQDIHYTRSTHSNQKVEEYLLEFFPQNKVDELMDMILEPPKKDESLKVFSHNKLNYVLDKTTGFIYSDNDDNQSSFKINYYYDLIEPTELKSIESLSTIEDAREKLLEFMESNDKLYVLKSAWGTGKTHNILKEAVKRNKLNKILVITGINSLNQTMTLELNKYLTELFEDDVPPNTLFVSHLECQTNKNIVLKKSNKVVCSIQSLMKIESECYDIVFIDEFESVLNGYYGYTTFKHQSINSLFNTLRNILRRSEKIITLDADISEPKINLLISMIGENNSYKIYKNLTKSFQSVQFNIHNDNFKSYMLHILSDQIDDKKLVIASATRMKAKKILYMLSNTMSEKDTLKNIDTEYSKLVEKYYDSIKDKIILYVDRDGIILYKTNGKHHVGTKYTNEEVYNNTDKFIQEHNVHTFIYTPTITTGISINELYFDKCYGISSNNSVVFNEFIQMLMRTRKHIMNEVNIWIQPHLFKPNSQQIATEHVLKSQTSRIHLLNEFNYKQNQELKMTIDTELSFTLEDYNNNGVQKLTTEHYCILQLINMCNLTNTKDNFVFNLLSTLKYHKLNIKYYQGKSKIKDDMIDDTKNKKAMKELDYDQWCLIPFMKFKDFVVEYVRYSAINKPKPNIIDIHLEYLNKYYKEPLEENKEIYYKSKNIYFLLKIQNTQYKLIQDCFKLMNEPTLENIYELDTMLNNSMNQDNDVMIQNIHRNINTLLKNHSKDSKIIQDCYTLISSLSNIETNYVYVHEMCDNYIEETIGHYDMNAIWDLYINRGKYADVYKIRSFVNSETNTYINKLTYTEEDVIKLDKQIMRVLCKHFSIDFNDPQTIVLTNKEFIAIFVKIQLELETLYHYVNDKPIECIADPKHPSYKSGMFNYMSKKLKTIDYMIQYENSKHTTRGSDKMFIAPNSSEAKDFIVDYKCMNKQVSAVKRLDEMFPYLQSRPYKSTLELYKSIQEIPIEKLNELIIKVGKNKYLSNKDKQSLCYMLIMYYNVNNVLLPNYRFNVEKSVNGLDTYKQPFMEKAFKQYYHSELYYMTYDPNKLSLEITYYDKSKNKKVEIVELQHSVVSTYKKRKDDTYERSEDKTITRPYKHQKVIMKNVIHYEKQKTEVLEIVSDILNDLVNCVLLNYDLKSHFADKPKLKSVEV